MKHDIEKLSECVTMIIHDYIDEIARKYDSEQYLKKFYVDLYVNDEDEDFVIFNATTSLADKVKYNITYDVTTETFNVVVSVDKRTLDEFEVDLKDYIV